MSGHISTVTVYGPDGEVPTSVNVVSTDEPFGLILPRDVRF